MHTEKIKSIINNYKELNYKEIKLNYYYEKNYLLPDKAEKSNDPGSADISSVDWHTSRISKFVDYYLQPAVKNCESYVEDTTDFIKK